MKRLAAIVTGMERSGTTIFSRVLLSHPQLWAGFECGLLLSNFRESVFYQWLRHGSLQFGLSEEGFQRILAETDVEKKYGLLREFGGLQQKGTPWEFMRDGFLACDYVVDKTPAYCYELEQVMDQTEAPVFVLYRDCLTNWDSFERRGAAEDYRARRQDFLRAVKACWARPDLRQRMHLVYFDEYVAHQKRMNAQVMKVLKHYLPSLRDCELGVQGYMEKLNGSTLGLKVGEYDVSSVRPPRRFAGPPPGRDLERLMAEDGFLEKHRLQ